VDDPKRYVEYIKSIKSELLETDYEYAMRLLYSKTAVVETSRNKLIKTFKKTFESKIYTVPGWDIGWDDMVDGFLTAGAIALNTIDHSSCDRGNCPICFITDSLPSDIPCCVKNVSTFSEDIYVGEDGFLYTREEVEVYNALCNWIPKAPDLSDGPQKFLNVSSTRRKLFLDV
jgi:hypothetical protein